MTERLYYDDAYMMQFRAKVVERLPYDGAWAVVLDRTAFYPTSGGQPFDQGVLNDAQVMDVVVREEDDAVLHVLEEDLDDASSEVLGEVDWQRRFDHMQQHTGQHILSQAFVEVAQAETVSFHLGSEGATIDLAADPRHRSPGQMGGVSPKDIERAEILANRIVFEDRPVTARIVSPDQVAVLPLRKPPAVSGDVRVVQIEGFDWSACGGTHVGRTGEVGLIKIIKEENRGSELRVEFRCGWRALNDYAQKNEMVNRVAAGFNVGYWDLDQAVERLTDELKEQRSELRQAARALAGFRAAELRELAPVVAGVRLVVHDLTAEPVIDLRELARHLVSEPGVVALLGQGDEKAQLCFVRSEDVRIDMVPLVREVSQALGSRGGGGKPDFAQGGGTLKESGQLAAVLEGTANTVCSYLERSE